MLTAKRLKEVLDYDPETGVFRWRDVFRMMTYRNGQVAGSPDGNGYIKISIDGVKHSSSRLAWLYVHGEWPSAEIDHINRVRGDNRIANLRDVSHAQNMWNTDSRSKASGLRCVARNGTGWAVSLQANKETHYLGTFESLDNAARVSAAAIEARDQGNLSSLRVDDIAKRKVWEKATLVWSPDKVQALAALAAAGAMATEAAEALGFSVNSVRVAASRRRIRFGQRPNRLRSIDADMQAIINARLAGGR